MKLDREMLSVDYSEQSASSRSNYQICEAINCYEAATESIVVSAGKFGTINLNLCHKCAVTKFQTTLSQDMILKKSRYTGQRTLLNQPVEDYGD